MTCSFNKCMFEKNMTERYEVKMSFIDTTRKQCQSVIKMIEYWFLECMCITIALKLKRKWTNHDPGRKAVTCTFLRHPNIFSPLISHLRFQDDFRYYLIFTHCSLAFICATQTHTFHHSHLCKPSFPYPRPAPLSPHFTYRK